MSPRSQGMWIPISLIFNRLPDMNVVDTLKYRHRCFLVAAFFWVVFSSVANAGTGISVDARNGRTGKYDIVVGGHGWYGFDIEDIRPTPLTNNGYMTYEAAVGFQTKPGSGCQYAEAFGFPMLSVGLSVASMGDFRMEDNTRFPNLYSVFGSFERSLLRTGAFSMGYQFDFGATYNPGRYDPVNSPSNNWLSTPFMAYFGAGVFAKFHIGKHWEVGADFMFRHYSNGRLALPNEALNALGGGLFARYRLEEYDNGNYRTYTKVANPEFDRGMQYMITLGTGFHTCQGEWRAYVENEIKVKDPGLSPEEKQVAASKLKAHPKFSLSFDALYRYALRYATGIGLDLFYSTNMKELAASDKVLYSQEAIDACPGYSPLSVGIAVVQEVYWRNLAVHVAIGAYPYRHKGVNPSSAVTETDKLLMEDDRERGWHYEKAGLRYYFPKLGNTFVGFAIKSHSIKAEYLEFSVGIRL